jgi:hypothetical protein
MLLSAVDFTQAHRRLLAGQGRDGTDKGKEDYVSLRAKEDNRIADQKSHEEKAVTEDVMVQLREEPLSDEQWHEIERSRAERTRAQQRERVDVRDQNAELDDIGQAKVSMQSSLQHMDGQFFDLKEFFRMVDRLGEDPTKKAVFQAADDAVPYDKRSLFGKV